MNFKDIVKQDINVLLNPLELAELHNLNGVETFAVVENNSSKERTNKKSDDYSGVFSGVVTVFVRAEDLTQNPVYKQTYKLDGKMFYVVSCTNDFGLLTIELGSNRI